MQKLKYDPDLYTNSEFFGADMDCEYRNLEEKLVKTRKPHICVNCQSEIPKGNYAVYEKAFGYEGPVSCYTCTDCIEEWLEESGQVDIEEED